MKESTYSVEELENPLKIMQQETREAAQKTKKDTSWIRRLPTELKEERKTEAAISARCNAAAEDQNGKDRDSLQQIHRHMLDIVERTHLFEK